MYNRYLGNSGRVVQVDDREANARPRNPRVSPLPPPSVPDKPVAIPKRPPGPLHNLRSSLGGIFSHLDPGRLKTEDLLVLLILYLIYRESGDTEFLLALAAFVFL